MKTIKHVFELKQTSSDDLTQGEKRETTVKYNIKVRVYK
jgi:hypothetical protein